MTKIDKEICALAMSINRQTRDLAEITSRRIRNVWVNDYGEIVTIESAEMLKAKEDDNKRILDDMLRALDVLIKERDGEVHITDRRNRVGSDGSPIPDTLHDTAEGRDGSCSDAPETE